MNSLYNAARLGRAAKSAWEFYVEGYVATRKAELFALFEEVGIQDKEALHELKRQSMMLNNLETQILVDIQNGKIAEEAMKDEN